MYVDCVFLQVKDSLTDHRPITTPIPLLLVPHQYSEVAGLTQTTPEIAADSKVYSPVFQMTRKPVNKTKKTANVIKKVVVAEEVQAVIHPEEAGF